jgi:FHS family L-fucose permease-like MFS transporter
MATIPTASTCGTTNHGANFRGPFAIMTSLFFLWGSMTVFNDILFHAIKRFSRRVCFDWFRACC